MKYLKKFEVNYYDIQIGEYVILKIDHIRFHKAYYTFLENNVGRIVGIDYFNVTIEYENIPSNLIQNFKNGTIKSDVSHIDKHSFDKEYLESILAAKKYNL